MFTQGLRATIMLLILLGGLASPWRSPPSSAPAAEPTLHIPQEAQAPGQEIQCEVLRFGIGEQRTGREVPPALRFKVDRALVFTGAIRTPEPIRFLTDTAIITDRGFTKRSLLGWVFRPSRQPTLPLNPDSFVDYMRDTYSPPFRVHIDLSRVQRAAYAGGVAVLQDLRTKKLLGFCSIFTETRIFEIPATDRVTEPERMTQERPDFILFTNDESLVLPQHSRSLLLGFNAGLLWVQDNTGEITIGFNLGSQVPGPNGPQGAGRIEIHANAGLIRLERNFGLVTVHSNDGVILIEANRPFGRILVEENRGTIRVLENQGEIEDPTETVEVRRSG